MIKIERINVMNINNAIHGMRNPLESWDKSDSFYGCVNGSKHDAMFTKCDECLYDIECNLVNNNYLLGEKDLNLAQRMIGAGTDESKFMRQIFVSMDITAPLYYWKEMDTYKVATVANSCSTMHKLATTPITKDCFSFDNDLDSLDTQFYNQEVAGFEYYFSVGVMNSMVINNCERLRLKYLETEDKRYWRALIQLLPESWNQKRTWTANYQVLRAIYFARRHHRLSEWHEFCRVIEQLPYGKELICYNGGEK